MLLEDEMFAEQQLALANLRFVNRTGSEPEFYDVLRGRLLDLADSWEGMQLSDDERATLAASRRRLLLELAYLRGQSVLRLGRARA